MAVSSAATLSPTAVLDEKGNIVSVNRAWKNFGEKNGLPEEYTVEGKNYVVISQQADDEYGKRVATELRRLLTGEQTEFTVVYPCHSPNQERWFRLYATTVSFGGDRYYLLVHQRANQDPRLSDKQPSDVMDTSTKKVDHRDRRRLVTYDLSSDESAIEGFIMAFNAIGVDTRRQDMTLHDWIDTSAINALQTSSSDFHLTFRVWNYPVGLTPDEVIIYTPERSSE
jgi:PAS domain-containing protein